MRDFKIGDHIFFPMNCDRYSNVYNVGVVKKVDGDTADTVGNILDYEVQFLYKVEGNIWNQAFPLYRKWVGLAIPVTLSSFLHYHANYDDYNLPSREDMSKEFKYVLGRLTR